MGSGILQNGARKGAYNIRQLIDGEAGRFGPMAPVFLPFALLLGFETRKVGFERSVLHSHVVVLAQDPFFLV